MSNMRNELGRFVGSKYKKINGDWYRSKCKDCGRWCKGYNTIRCQPCRVKVQTKPAQFVHNMPHSKETIERLRILRQKEKLTYSGLHGWLRREFGVADKCENADCLGKSQFYDWANISGEYRKDRTHYRMLCRSCHHLFDKSNIKPRFI